MAAMEVDAPPINEEIQPSDPQSTDIILSSEQGGATAAAGEIPSHPTEGLDSSEKRKREEETPPISDRKPLWKTSLCSYFRRQSGGGSCSHGADCRYAHGEAELRPRPDKSWDPTSLRAIKHEHEAAAAEAEVPPVVSLDFEDLDKCLIGLPRKWASDSLKSFLNDQGISYKTAKKKKGMAVGFVGFENTDQVKTAIEVLNENSTGGKQIIIADAIRRSYEKKSIEVISLDENEQRAENHSGSEDQPPISSSLNKNNDAVDKGTSVVGGLVSKARRARDVVTPLAHMPYSDQLELKKNSLLQTLKRLTRNARKACPDAVPLSDWIVKSRDIGGLPCKLEGIIESPLIYGYRNKCEFSVGYSLQGKPTVGFTLGNFREGVTAVEEPVDCPNVSRTASNFALIFQEFLQSSLLPVWNRIENTGFWRQFTVREGRNPSQVAVAETTENQIAEIMLIIQVCSLDVDAELMKNEFERMAQVLAQRAASCSPPLPLTTIVVQDHKGISNAAPGDCPLILLPVPKVAGYNCSEKPYAIEARIHDYISNLRFCISPTAFFQVNTLAAERLYSLAGDWADLNPDTLLFDVCCGTGTIGLTLAHRVGMVVGIEMNDSAVKDAHRNAEINGIKNCRFVCGKAEDVMGPLLKEYLDVPQQHGVVSDASRIKSTANDQNVVNDMDDEKMLQPNACTLDDVLVTNASIEKMTACSEDKDSERMEIPRDPDQNFEGNTKPAESPIDYIKEKSGIDSLANEGSDKEIVDISPVFLKSCTAELRQSNQENSECRDTSQENGTSEDSKERNTAPLRQFKNVVAIVDPPRVGLHPVVIKALRTHPRLRRLVYISCNPESLVANAIELCTPTADKPEKGKGNRGWRGMSSASLARHRTKSMPNSEPFGPVRAMAVDLFPHTPHCEMVMLLER